MRKILVFGICVLLAAGLLWGGSVILDRKMLDSDLVRLHIVAQSDSEEDQAVKLRVRDAVTAYLQDALAGARDSEEARAVLRRELPALEELANRVLAQAGASQTATAQLTREAFDSREYDTFSLPAGVYHSLRITIGQGQGRNWWCVVFPSLCVPATAAEFEDTAREAGMSDALECALTGQEEYRARFYLLELLGRVEIFLSRG